MGRWRSDWSNTHLLVFQKNLIFRNGGSDDWVDLFLLSILCTSSHLKSLILQYLPGQSHSSFCTCLAHVVISQLNEARLNSIYSAKHITEIQIVLMSILGLVAEFIFSIKGTLLFKKMQNLTYYRGKILIVPMSISSLVAEFITLFIYFYLLVM
jgi:hypothetical protein